MTDNISPDFVSTFVTNEDYDNVVRNYGSILFKIEVLKTLSSLNLPMGLGNVTVQDLEKDITSSFEPLQQVYANMPDLEGKEEFANMWQKQIKNIDDKVKIINDQFQKFNLNFTVGDIINQFVEETKKKAIEIEKEKEARELIGDIMAEGVQQ